MKELLRCVFTLMATALVLTACVDEEEYSDDARGNFEALWRIIDEHYCYLDEKNIDWNAIHKTYGAQVHDDMTIEQLFEVLGNMLGELRDGHVNLSSPFDNARNWSWHEDYPTNFSDSLQRRYLGTDYRLATGLQYRVLDDNIGYLYCGSFNNELGSGNLDQIMLYLAPCNGLIVDVRNNSGGLITSAEELAARFTNEELLVGYLRHKTGKGHSDFSPMKEQRLKPGKGLRWQKRVVVLTNRLVFSAANEFVKYMRCCPNVTVVGDHTGGGAGMPFNSELPNGWGVRFSACPMYDRNKLSTEDGMAPDHEVHMTDTDFRNGRDTIIEFARKLINE